MLEKQPRPLLTQLSGKDEMNVAAFEWRGRSENRGLVGFLLYGWSEVKEGVAESSVIGQSCRGNERTRGKKGNRMERVTMQKEEEDICDISRQMLCWPWAADSNSRVQDRNHSTKGKAALFVTDRTKRLFVWDRRLTRQCNSKKGGKMRKVQRLPLQKDEWKYVRIEREESAGKHDMKEKQDIYKQAKISASRHLGPGVQGVRIVNTSVRCLKLLSSEFMTQTKMKWWNVFAWAHLHTCACRLHCECWAGLGQYYLLFMIRSTRYFVNKLKVIISLLCIWIMSFPDNHNFSDNLSLHQWHEIPLDITARAAYLIFLQHTVCHFQWFKTLKSYFRNRYLTVSDQWVSCMTKVRTVLVISHEKLLPLHFFEVDRVGKRGCHVLHCTNQSLVTFESESDDCCGVVCWFEHCLLGMIHPHQHSPDEAN